MISVIMPTMWRSNKWKKMLPLLDSHDLVGELFIIDNDPINCDLDQIFLQKLTYFKSEKNLLVNPSWNFAVNESKYDKICLLSDDVLFDVNCINSVYKKITSDNGIIGFSSTSIFPDEASVYFSEWEQKQIAPINHIHQKFGICMFLHKSSYYTIPENLKIFYGDTFLFTENIKNKKQNWEIQNYFAVTVMGSTSKSDEFKNFIQLEKEQYKNIKSYDKLI